MYNAELKERFIREYTDSLSHAEACKWTFDAVEPYEVEWEADICTRSKDDVQVVIDNIVGLKVSGFHSRLGVVKKYVEWCIKNNVPDACDGALQVQTVGLNKMKAQTVSNPLHLQNYLNSILNPESYDDMDNVYRCYYWLAYSGVPEKDVLSITVDDVDFENMVIRYNNTEAPIYREAIPAFKRCVKLTRFVSKNRNYTDIFYRDRVGGNLLLRGTHSNPTIINLRNEMSSYSTSAIRSGKTDLRLSYKRVEMSGLFYRQYEKECASIPINFVAIASDFVEGKTYKLGSNSLNNKIKCLASQYAKDYERWKLTFLTK